MVQIVATLISLLLGASALIVIGFSVADDWDALKQALGFRISSATPQLPPRTRQITPARRARIIRLSVEALPQRAAA
jgi:hypothetical protein